MMTGLIFVVFNPSNFWVVFILSEIVGYLSTQPKEGLLMIIKAFGEVKSFAKQAYQRVITAWELHLPYRFNLLMIR
tara:strand:- start:1530 stop:1757 length:228 start_codon:yes stop_codon:yes gene_type:complete